MHPWAGRSVFQAFRPKDLFIFDDASIPYVFQWQAGLVEALPGDHAKAPPPGLCPVPLPVNGR